MASTSETNVLALAVALAALTACGEADSPSATSNNETPTVSDSPMAQNDDSPTGSASDQTDGMNDQQPAVDDAPQSIVDIALADENFTQLVGALQATNLVDTLSGEGPFTVFAPTDAAFAAFEEANPGALDSLSTDALASVLTYHVVAGEVLSTDLVDGSIARTVQGGLIGIGVGDGVTINDAQVTTADIRASNGVIHVIDTIVTPPTKNIVETAVDAGQFTQLAGALTEAGLIDALSGEGPFTVFAPTDAAFAAFEEANPGVLGSLATEDLTNILLYHVVNGSVAAADLSDGMTVGTLLEGRELSFDLSQGARVNDASISTTNILTSNGVIHVIDEILLPPSN